MACGCRNLDLDTELMRETIDELQQSSISFWLCTDKRLYSAIIAMSRDNPGLVEEYIPCPCCGRPECREAE